MKKEKRWKFKEGSRDNGWFQQRTSYETELVPVTYVVYDDEDNVIPVKTFEYYCHGYEHPGPEGKAGRYKRSPWVIKGHPGFRNGPIPGTGGYGNGSWYRRPKTTQETKMNCAHTEYTRGKRRNLVTWWDDVPRSDSFIKHSWKKQRKRKQWM